MIGKTRIIIALTAISSVVSTAWGVTEKEMEQARVIAAQAYLRYANDGSGYLDDIKVSTMAELESKLKKTEKENLAAFKTAANPTGYASWTKEQLVEYWGDTFFRSSALTEKGKMAKSRVKKRIGAMTIAAPSAEPAETPVVAVAEEKPEPEQQPEEEVNQEKQAAMPEEFTAAAQAIDSVAAALEEDADEFEQRKNERSSSTWVYVVILAVLVGIVVWLVVFASKMMKSVPAQREKEREERDYHLTTDLRARALAAQTEITRLRSEIDRLTAEKDTEISTLRTRCEQSAFEVSRLRAELTDARSRMAAAERVDRKKQVEEVERIEGREAARTIYLGRVNASGLFVRADRGVVLGSTVYRLDTSDGFSGTFRVVNNPQVWESLLRNPGEMLAVGCVAEDLLDTDGFTKIVTETAGTAIFENGCWRVLRQCRIRYE